MTDSPQGRCSICDTEASQKCSGCGQMWYCSKACQKTDWVVHKLLCSAFAGFRTPPKLNQRRAILFQQDVDRPQFVWVDTFLTLWGYEEMPLNKLLTIPGKGSERDTPELTRLPLVNDSRKRRLRHALTLICRDEFTKDGSVPNKSIINATDRKMKYGWRGPILVVAQSISRASDPPYEDVTLHDFRDIIDYFLTYNGGPTSQMRVQIVKKTQAIRIHCPAHMVASKVAKFSIEKINTIHPVYSNRPLIDSITSKINLPLCILRIPPDLKWSSKKEDFVNHTAACLALDGSDPESHFDNWYKEGGDALVARADSHHLLPEHLEVLADFCETKVYLLLADAMNTPNYLENINSVFMEHVTEEKFTLYWETYRRKKAISDPRWRNVSSPYY